MLTYKECKKLHKQGVKPNTNLKWVCCFPSYPMYQPWTIERIKAAKLDPQSLTPCYQGELKMNYRQLKAALAELTEEQLDMSVTVSSGCDENGNAEFFQVDALTLAMNPDVQAATEFLFEPQQPIILFQE